MKPHAPVETDPLGQLLEFGPGDGHSIGAPQSRWGLWWEHHPLALRVLAVTALGWGGRVSGLAPPRDGPASRPSRLLRTLARGAVQLHLARLPRLLRLGLVAPGTPAGHAGHSVDVFVATYDEPLEVLEATLAGCAALSYPHETFLLDDGRRWEMAALAAEWGAQWITRPDNSHAKAATSTTPFPAPAAS